MRVLDWRWRTGLIRVKIVQVCSFEIKLRQVENVACAVPSPSQRVRLLGQCQVVLHLYGKLKPFSVQPRLGLKFIMIRGHKARAPKSGLHPNWYCQEHWPYRHHSFRSSHIDGTSTVRLWCSCRWMCWHSLWRMAERHPGHPALVLQQVNAVIQRLPNQMHLPRWRIKFAPFS